MFKGETRFFNVQWHQRIIDQWRSGVTGIRLLACFHTRDSTINLLGAKNSGFQNWSSDLSSCFGRVTPHQWKFENTHSSLCTSCLHVLLLKLFLHQQQSKQKSQQASMYCAFGGAVPMLSPCGSGRPGLLFTAVMVVTTVPQGMTVRSISTLLLEAGVGGCQDLTSLGSR